MIHQISLFYRQRFGRAARWSILGIGLSGLLPITGFADNSTRDLPRLGSAARTVYSQEQEQILGRQVMVQIRQSRSFIDDPELSQYIQALGSGLAKHAEHKQFRFFLIRDPSINAFALPGGYIGINSGLIAQARDESELAAVLAHEIVHVDQQHWSRLMAARQERSGLTAAALLASVILAGSGNQQAGEAGIAITTAANMAQELSYSRDYEREADRLGIQLLAKSGFRAESMADFFERLQRNHRIMGANAPEYLRTHPIETNRIAEARDRARTLRKPTKTTQTAFLFAKARLIALYTVNRETTETLLKREIFPKSSKAYQYGQAILLNRFNQPGAALALAGKLGKQSPDEIRYLLLSADINLKLSNKNKGLSLLSEASRRSGGAKSVLLRQANALVDFQEYEQAFRLLEKLRTHPPDSPSIEHLYARAAGETGRLLESHRAMAEFYYLQGGKEAAYQQLRIARKHAKGNPYYLAGIDARLEEMKNDQ